MVPDVNGLNKLDPEKLRAIWTADVERIADHYGFDQDQREKSKAELQDAEDDAVVWFNDKENEENRAKYWHELNAVIAIERNPKALSFERERAAARRKDLDADRRKLTDGIDTIGDALHDAVTKLATPEQREAAGAYKPPMTTLDWVNLSTTYGLIAIGLCLMAGFLTPLAALGGAVFLAQIYLSMPPWPWLPANPRAEGHYLFVDKNLVEMLACLALVFIPTGRWIGFDSLFFGLFGRRRPVARDATSREPSRESGPGTGRERLTQPADTGPIPF
jgi:uncharacterized membrane protein YphA (DoxX/SURF4 family)